jgi:hypothetical protein
MFTRLILITALLVLPAASLHADLLVYEGFDYAYSTGETLTGKNGGAGFAAAWQPGVNPSTGANENQLLINDGGLAYPMLASAGNAAWDDSGSSQANYREWDTTGHTDSGDSLWFSFLFNTSTESTSSELRVFALGNDNYNAGAGAMAFNTGLLHAQLGGSRSAGISYNRGVDNLVVGLVSFTGDDSAGSVTVWLNPSLGEIPDVADGVTRTGTTSTATWSTLYMRGGSNWRGQVDEVRIGTSFFDVVPVPEPASALLAVCGTIGLFLMRRRHAFVENA